MVLAERDDSGSALDAYEALASAYDLLSREYAYERWLPALERLAIDHGLAGQRVLDVACGTGKSFLPLLARGYRITACDISPSMVALAAAKAPDVPLLVADMRALPPLGEFDLVTCLGDAVNYLLDPGELTAALRGIRRSLGPLGLAIWDANTPAMHRSAFASTWAIEDEQRIVLWRGRSGEGFATGGLARAEIDVFAHAGENWTRSRSTHTQRHWPAHVLCASAREAGLRIVAVRGQRSGATLEPELDEDVHTKAVFLACRDDRAR